jgi:hypothetical protein
VSFALLCSFAGGVEPFLAPLEEPVICERCVCGWFLEIGVWELLCSICIALSYAFLAFWHGMCNMMYRNLCILGCMYFVSYALFRKSFSYIHCSA